MIDCIGVQIVFLQTAESLLLAPGQRAASLFTLVTYNCTVFCCKYLHSLVTKYDDSDDDDDALNDDDQHPAVEDGDDSREQRGAAPRHVRHQAHSGVDQGGE